MKYQYSKAHELANEDGAILPFLAVTLIVGLIFAALGVDLGEITRRENLLQSSLDAAVLRGASALRDAPLPRNADTEAEIVALTRDVFEANLKAKGVDAAAIENTLAELHLSTPFYDRVSAASNIEHRNWFAQVAISADEYLHANGYAKARFDGRNFNPNEDCAVLSLLIDASASMSDLAPRCFNCANISKIESVQRAARRIVASLPDYYYVNVIYFNSQITDQGNQALHLGTDNNRSIIDSFLSSAPNPLQPQTNTSAGLQDVATITSSACTNNYHGTILVTDGMPDYDISNSRTQENASGLGPDNLYNCPESPEGTLDHAIGNAIAWSDLIRGAQNSPIYALGYGTPNVSGSYESEFLGRLAGTGEYSNLTCSRPVVGGEQLAMGSSLIQGNNYGQYYNSFEERDFNADLDDALLRFKRNIGELNTLRLVD